MSTLQLVWFVLIGVLFSGFFFLEGFDFGVGMSVQTLAKNKNEKDQVIATIGPLWDGNEVWLLTAGGAMFASFPYWYASLFSGFYLILLIILFGLIIRGASFEFRHHTSEARQKIWDWAIALGSFLVPFFFGLLFISLIQGMPIDQNGNMTASFSDYINVFSIVGGVAVSLLAYLHGMNYLALKTTGPIRERAKKQVKTLYWLLYVGLIAFALLMYLRTDFFTMHFASTVGLLVLIVGLTVLANISVGKNWELTAFLASGLTFIALVALLFTGLFPRVMIGKPGYSDILIVDASSSPYTLKIMSIIVCTILPVVLGYMAWSYFVFRKRVSHTEKTEGY